MNRVQRALEMQVARNDLRRADFVLSRLDSAVDRAIFARWATLPAWTLAWLVFAWPRFHPEDLPAPDRNN